MVATELRQRRAACEAEHCQGHARRPLIDASWDRCRDLVAPTLACAPMDLTPEVASHAWIASPLCAGDIDLAEQLRSLVGDADVIAVIADEKCRVLWAGAAPVMQRRAADIGLVPGTQWDELAFGTNAIALAYETGDAATVFAGEHWCDALAELCGWAVPIQTPTGACLGVLAVYARWNDAQPMVVPALTLLARLAAEHLPDDLHPVAHAHGVELHVLGTPRVALHGEVIALSPRQVELLAILALEEVATLDQFIDRVYGDRPVSPSTVKAELSHLRNLLGGAIGSRPYRLTVPIWVDALEVRRRLMLGDLDGALRHYHGQLLPKSEAPFAADYRHVTDVVLRSALLERGSADQLLAFAAIHRYDEAVLERIVAITPSLVDSRRVEAEARLANLRCTETRA